MWPPMPVFDAGLFFALRGVIWTNLGETISLEMDKCKSKNVALVSEVLALLSWSFEG